MPNARAFFAIAVAVTVPHVLVTLRLILRDALLALEAVHRRDRDQSERSIVSS